MKLIRKTRTGINKNGYKIRYGIFLCPYDNKEIEMQISNGMKANSCKEHSKGNYKHGETYTRLYQIWYNMKQRCLNIKSKAYKDYGGRGITICPEWTNDYIKFRDWSLSNGYQESLEIDRIDNNGNYEPSNCRFVTSQKNSQKRRTSKLTQQTANKIRELCKTGEYTQKELSKKYNISTASISYIINNKIWRN